MPLTRIQCAEGEMEQDIRKVWRSLRSILKDACTFAVIKDLVAESALPVGDLSHLQLRSLPARGASKSELLDAVDDLVNKENNPTEAIQFLIAAFLERRPRLHARFGHPTSRSRRHLLTCRRKSGNCYARPTGGTTKATIQEP